MKKKEKRNDLEKNFNPGGLVLGPLGVEDSVFHH